MPKTYVRFPAQAYACLTGTDLPVRFASLCLLCTAQQCRMCYELQLNGLRDMGSETTVLSLTYRVFRVAVRLTHADITALKMHSAAVMRECLGMSLQARQV